VGLLTASGRCLPTGGGLSALQFAWLRALGLNKPWPTAFRPYCHAPPPVGLGEVFGLGPSMGEPGEACSKSGIAVVAGWAPTRRPNHPAAEWNER